MTTEEKLDQIKHLLEKRAEGKLDYDSDQRYQTLRRELLDDSGIEERLPECIRASRSTNDVWPYLQRFKTWKERRQYIAEQLRPAFQYIEQQRRCPAPDFAPDPEAFVSKLAQWLMAQNKEREVAILTGGASRLVLSSADVYDGTPWNIEIGLPLDFFNSLTEKERQQAETQIHDAARTVARTKNDDYLHTVRLFVDIDPLPDWRTHALTSSVARASPTKRAFVPTTCQRWNVTDCSFDHCQK